MMVRRPTWDGELGSVHGVPSVPARHGSRGDVCAIDGENLGRGIGILGWGWGLGRTGTGLDGDGPAGPFIVGGRDNNRTGGWLSLVI